MSAQGTSSRIPLTTVLTGVGNALADKLAKLHIINLADLLLHLPLRYEDRTQITPLHYIKPHSHFLVQGVIKSSQINRSRRPTLQVVLSDDTASLSLRFINFYGTQLQSFATGKQVVCYGEVRSGMHGLEMVHPEYRFFSGAAPELEENLTPVYPTTEGISQTRIRELVMKAWQQFEQNPTWLQELLPQEFVKHRQLPSLYEALQQLHFPKQNEPLSLMEINQSPAYQRLIIEELLAHQLCLQKARQKAFIQPAPQFPNNSHQAKCLLDGLAFELTSAQARVWQEISTDINSTQPMLRMLQGDVGSGKTVIAALVTCQAMDAGYQVAVLAPTEILAEQHLHNFQQWLHPLGIEVVFLVGSQKTAPRRDSLAAIAAGTAQVIIGTHALYQEKVVYQRLGLVIVDEQHRFGVEQRRTLLKKAPDGTAPHQLIMSATPIPRTLAMTAYGDLDHSIIDELPPGRKPVKTMVISNQKRADIMARILHVCQSGMQVYWICPLIEHSEVLQCEAAEETLLQLTETLPELRIALVHGRIEQSEKVSIMAAFKAGEIDLLVATTVIEVGVDVPNANLMIIDNAERLGLAQLHQLRGRVGRGQSHSHCVLMYQAPLSRLARERLNALRESNDGFVIAEKDLQLRGPGEVLGTRQAGAITLRIADLLRDAHLLTEVHQLALSYEKTPMLGQQLITRWIGSREKFMDV